MDPYGNSGCQRVRWVIVFYCSWLVECCKTNKNVPNVEVITSKCEHLDMITSIRSRLWNIVTNSSHWCQLWESLPVPTVVCDDPALQRDRHSWQHSCPHNPWGRVLAITAYQLLTFVFNPIQRTLLLSHHCLTPRSWATPCDINAIYTSLKSTFSRLQFRLWQYGSAFIRLAVIAFYHEKCREIPRESDLTAVQGLPRSSILVSMKSPYVTSY